MMLLIVMEISCLGTVGFLLVRAMNTGLLANVINAVEGRPH